MFIYTEGTAYSTTLHILQFISGFVWVILDPSLPKAPKLLTRFGLATCTWHLLR